MVFKPPLALKLHNTLSFMFAGSGIHEATIDIIIAGGEESTIVKLLLHNSIPSS